MGQPRPGDTRDQAPRASPGAGRPHAPSSFQSRRLLRHSGPLAVEIGVHLSTRPAGSGSHREPGGGQGSPWAGARAPGAHGDESRRMRSGVAAPGEPSHGEASPETCGVSISCPSRPLRPHGPCRTPSGASTLWVQILLITSGGLEEAPAPGPSGTAAAGPQNSVALCKAGSTGGPGVQGPGRGVPLTSGLGHGASAVAPSATEGRGGPSGSEDPAESCTRAHTHTRVCARTRTRLRVTGFQTSSPPAQSRAGMGPSFCL